MAYTYYKEAEFTGGWHSGRIGLEVVSQNIAENYSVVNLKFQVRKDVSSSSYNLGGANLYIALDGAVKVSWDTIDFRTYVIGTWYNNLQALSVIVYHGTDGKKTISLQGYCATGVGAGTYNQTQSIALPDIPRKSSISSLTGSVSVNGSNAVTVNIARADASFTHTVLFSIGAYSQSFTGVATSQTYAIPTTWLNAIPNSVSGTATCRVTTYNGGVNMGYVESTFAIDAPTTVIPVVSDIAFFKVADVFSSGVFVKGISKLSITGVTVTNQYSAITQSYYYGIHLAASGETTGLQYTQANAPLTSDIVQTAGSMKLSVKVTDSRTRQSAYYGEAFTVYDYSPPSVTVTAERCDASGTPDPNGSYIKMRLQASISPVNNDNSKIYTLKYKKTSDSTWTSVDVSGLTSYAVDQSYIRAASSSYTWEVQGSAQDKVSIVSKTVQATTAQTIMDFLAGGTGMAIGKVAETADVLEVDMATKFGKSVEIDGVIGGLVPTGSILMWPASTPPLGWQICDGSAAATTALQAIVGANVPDMRTRVPVGKNASGTFATLKGTGGAETHTLTEAQMPVHTHTQNSHNHTQNAHDHSVRFKGFNVSAGSPGYYVLRRQDAADSYDGTDGDAAIAATATNIAATATNQNTGGGAAHNNLQPYIILNFIIKA